MDTLKKIFPLSFRGKDNTSLIIAIIIYIVAPAVVGVFTGLLSGVPVLGPILGAVTSLIGLYAFVGLVLAILYRVDVIKD